MVCNNLENIDGKLFFAGINTLDLIKEYGSPSYIMDENKIRENCKQYKNAVEKYFPEGSNALYAGKACCFKKLVQIISEEGLYLDVVSVGEIYTAIKADFNMENVFYHSNNKTDADIKFAINNKVGYFVVESLEEIEAIQTYAQKNNIIQKVLVRITPGIDPHTFEEVATGKVDSKFGISLEKDIAIQFINSLLKCPNIQMEGFHCHVGSQVFESQVFLDASAIMLDFINQVKLIFDIDTKILNLGGGYGTKYLDSDPVLDIDKNLQEVANFITDYCNNKCMNIPQIFFEPGRSIVADAGLTLYNVGTVKSIPGYKSYVSVNGGMTDNPRYALYKSEYTVLVANKLNEEKDFLCDLVGCCCESGDVIQPDVLFPKSIQKNDIIAVCTTGAYNYSMASNYNRIPRLPVIMIKNKKSYIAVKRESLDCLIQNDI